MERWARRHATEHQFWRPTNVDDIRKALVFAESARRSVVPRGAGSSSADAILNSSGITIDLSQMKRMTLDLQRRVIQVEPGVTMNDLCRETMVHGLWPEVLPSISAATVAGNLSVNACGTNAWRQGPLGENIKSFELMIASGDILDTSLRENTDLFFSAIGGLGMLGIIVSTTLPLRPIHSSNLQTYQLSAHSLHNMVELFMLLAEETQNMDYIVGWIDGYAQGSRLGRGVVMSAKFLEEPDPDSLHVGMNQRIAEMPFIQQALPLLLRGRSLKIANAIRYGQNRNRAQYIPMTKFHFHFHPWYLPLHAMSQVGSHSFQPFVPMAYAPAIFTELLTRSQQEECIPFRCILRRHRPDDFMLSSQVDGFSLELTYDVPPKKQARLLKLLEAMRERVINVGGRLHPAKDKILDRQSYTRSMNETTISNFLKIKEHYDPKTRFQSDLFRRLFR